MLCCPNKLNGLRQTILIILTYSHYDLLFWTLTLLQQCFKTATMQISHHAQDYKPSILGLQRSTGQLACGLNTEKSFSIKPSWQIERRKDSAEGRRLGCIHSLQWPSINLCSNKKCRKRKKKQALSLSPNNKRLKNMMTHYFCLDFPPQFVFKPCQHTGG